MNRVERRQYERQLRHRGATKAQAKAYANALKVTPLHEGDVVKFNMGLIHASSEYKLQEEDFKNFVEEHSNTIFKVRLKEDATLGYGLNVYLTDYETEEEYPWLINAATLTQIATATIKLEDGTEKKIALDGVTSTDDPIIQEKINEAMEEN